MAAILEADIQEQLLSEYRDGLTETDEHETDTEYDELAFEIDRTTRAWSWPMDRQQRKRLKQCPMTGNPWEQHDDQFEGKDPMLAVWTMLAWAGMLVTLGWISYLAAPQPAILQGWSKRCPPNWLYSTSPDMILMGYQSRFEDVLPPWSALRESEKTFKLCWHSDRNGLHQGYHLNVSLPDPKSSQAGAANLPIMRRGEDAFDHFDECTYPCSEPFQTEPDGLPQLASECQQRCGFRVAGYMLFSAITNPLYAASQGNITTAEQLPRYCPCSFKLAWHNLRRTHVHLPKPRSIHPFYTDRKTSSLYRKYDIYSWWIWLWGNNFFVPWRRTSIEQVPDNELRDLYIQGHWNNQMGGLRGYTMAEVRVLRGTKLSKRQRQKIALKCEGSGSWCIDLYSLYGT